MGERTLSRTRTRASAATCLGLLLASTALVACAPAARIGSLPPTLSLEQPGGNQVAIQNGIPVPTFEAQARRRIDLSGSWRVEPMRLDSTLSLTDRADSLDDILAEGEGREAALHDDSAWAELGVPGSLNPPPDGIETGAWYRRSFYVPSSWVGQAATLKFEAVNYVADVWVNGTHLGYHEGGYTPFAFDVSANLVARQRNVIAVRVDNPQWGSRNDIVPWGLADWWNYGGITRPVWIEATEPLHVVRADAVPHLDGVDLAVTVRRAATLVGDSQDEVDAASPSALETTEASVVTDLAGPEPSLQVAVFGAEVDPGNLTDPLARSLVEPGRPPITLDELPLPDLDPGGVAQLHTGFLLGGADRWQPSRPALYVLRATAEVPGGPDDELWTSFGLRHVAVGTQGRLLLNGAPATFTGVGLHDERLLPDPEGEDEAATGHRISEAGELLEQLERARDVDAELIRAGHTPANPLLLMLADRLGFAVWEEIPLYHYTPLTFDIAMGRGIPQQMLREMALRDMNRPSVLFHGLANESTGTDERLAALTRLHEIDREIDGTRLTGQAAYGFQPDDPTNEPLDVAGFTFYFGVFYGEDYLADTARALDEAHAANPDKPVLALEFGRWADGRRGLILQQETFEETYAALESRLADERGGYVAATVWWALEDFATMMRGIGIEHFGLFDQHGNARPAARSAAELFSAVAGQGAEQMIESDVNRADVARPDTGSEVRLLAYLAYGLLVSVGSMAVLLFVLLHRGGRATGQPFRSPGR